MTNVIGNTNLDTGVEKIYYKITFLVLILDPGTELEIFGKTSDI